jgi:hypothetical protein
MVFLAKEIESGKDLIIKVYLPEENQAFLNET